MQTVVMTKWAGLEGTAHLAERCGRRLAERYPAHLIETARGFLQYLSVQQEKAIAEAADVRLMQEVSEGGVFGALWTLGQRAGCGLRIELKKIPIRQETVEICNFLDLNPYRLLGTGSLLCITSQGEVLAARLQEAGIDAAVIGFTAPGHDRVVQNKEFRRFLEPVGVDEIHRAL